MIQTNVRRPKTATNCAPPIPDVLCAIPSGSSGNLNFFGCQTAIGSGVLGAYQIYGQPLDIDATILTLQVNQVPMRPAV